MTSLALAQRAATSRPVDLGRILLLGAIWALLVLFVLYPLGRLVLAAVGQGDATTLGTLLTSGNTVRALANSLLLAALVGAVGTVLGLLFAFTAERAGIGRSSLTLLDSATLLPLISPPFTTSIGFVFSFGPRGLISYDLLGLTNARVYGLPSTLAAEALTYFPIAYLTLRPMLAAIGGQLDEAAASLGGSRARIFRTVTLPLLRPGLANAFLLLFAASLADFATPLILAGNQFPVLPTEAYLQITGMFDLRGGAGLSLLLLVPAVLVFLAQQRLVAGRSYVTVTGKAAGGGAAAIAPRTRALLLGLCALVTLSILYLYALLLIASVVVAFGANSVLTTAHYRVIFTEGLPIIEDTLIIALVGMPLGGLYGLLMGYLLGRISFPGRRAMELVSMLNYALPGTIVGIAYLIAFNDGPLTLTGTATILIAAYVFRYSPTGIRATIAMVAQLDRSLEEASTSLGANRADHLPPDRAAAARTRLPCRAQDRVHSLHDRDQRDHFPRLARLVAHHSQDPGKHDGGRARPGRGVLRLRHRRRAGRHPLARFGIRPFPATADAPMTSSASSCAASRLRSRRGETARSWPCGISTSTYARANYSPCSVRPAAARRPRCGWSPGSSRPAPEGS